MFSDLAPPVLALFHFCPVLCVLGPHLPPTRMAGHTKESAWTWENLWKLQQTNAQKLAHNIFKEKKESKKCKDLLVLPFY